MGKEAELFLALAISDSSLFSKRVRDFTRSFPDEDKEAFSDKNDAGVGTK
jgi:hypothetical protein